MDSKTSVETDTNAENGGNPGLKGGVAPFIEFETWDGPNADIKVVCKTCDKSFPAAFDSPTQAYGCAASVVHGTKEKYVQGYYGSSFDHLGDSSAWYFRATNEVDAIFHDKTVKATKTVETDGKEPDVTTRVHTGPVCDDCIKSWIVRGYLYRKDCAPHCAHCKQTYKSFDEFRDRILISLRRRQERTDQISGEIPLYFGPDSIYRIDEADVKAFKYEWDELHKNVHFPTDEVYRLSSELWLCVPCFETRTKHEVRETKCCKCQTAFRNCSTQADKVDGCCMTLTLSGPNNLVWGATSKWQSDHQNPKLFWNENLTFKEARKMCGSPICDDCIQKFVDVGHMIWTGTATGSDPVKSNVVAS